MHKKLLAEELRLFGKEVKTFPSCIRETFDSLVNLLPAGDTRQFYGLSECTADGIIYRAAALEMHEGEAEQYGCERYVISKGEYLCIPLDDWQEKIPSIRLAFEEILKNELADRTQPAIEEYLNDKEMLCMVKIDAFKQLTAELKSVTEAFIEAFATVDEQAINKLTTQGKWSAAQVAEHVNLSDKGMIRILNGSVRKAERDPAQNIWHIKDEFLDYDTKNESPDFVVPANKMYNKAQLLASFTTSRGKLQETLSKVDLKLIYDDFPFPGPDGMSGLELMAFIVYHTERHRHQLQMIKEKLANTTSSLVTEQGF